MNKGLLIIIIIIIFIYIKRSKNIDRLIIGGQRKINIDRSSDKNLSRQDITRVHGTLAGGEDLAVDLLMKSGALDWLTEGAKHQSVDYLDHIQRQHNINIDCPCYECITKNLSRGTEGGISYNDINICELEGDISDYDQKPRWVDNTYGGHRTYSKYVHRKGWDDNCDACASSCHNTECFKTCKNKDSQNCFSIPWGIGNCDCLREWDPENNPHYQGQITNLDNEITQKQNQLMTSYCDGKQEYIGGEHWSLSLPWGPGCSGITSQEDCEKGYESSDGAHCEWEPDGGECTASDQNFCEEEHIHNFLDKIEGVTAAEHRVSYAPENRIPEGEPNHSRCRPRADIDYVDRAQRKDAECNNVDKLANSYYFLNQPEADKTYDDGKELLADLTSVEEGVVDRQDIIDADGTPNNAYKPVKQRDWLREKCNNIIQKNYDNWTPDELIRDNRGNRGACDFTEYDQHSEGSEREARPPWAGSSVFDETSDVHTLRRLVYLFHQSHNRGQGGCDNECWKRISDLSRRELIKELEYYDLEYSITQQAQNLEKMNELYMYKNSRHMNIIGHDNEDWLDKKRKYITRTHKHRDEENYRPKCIIRDDITLDDASGDFQDIDEIKNFCNNDYFHRFGNTCNNFSCKRDPGPDSCRDLGKEPLCEFRDLFKLNLLSADKREEWLNNSEPTEGLERECWRQWAPQSDVAKDFFGDTSSNPWYNTPNTTWGNRENIGGIECMCRDEPLNNWRRGQWFGPNGGCP